MSSNKSKMYNQINTPLNLMMIKGTFVFISIVLILGCNFNHKDKSNTQAIEKNQIDSSKILNKPKYKQTFQGEKIWIKQFQCDGYFYTSNIFTDSLDNLFWFVHFEGILKIDSANIFKNYSEKILVLQFDSKGSLTFNQYIGGNDLKLFQILQYQNSFYPIFTEDWNLNSVQQGLAYSMSKNQKYKQETIKIYEISANEKASDYMDILLEKQKSISTVQFDKNQNLILAGSKAIVYESGMGQCEPYTKITNSIPYIEKRKGDTVLWEFSCSNNCLGRVSSLFVDEQNNIWINFQIRSCDKMLCFNTEKYSGIREKTFIAKVSENGNLIFNKEMQEYNSRWLKIQNFRKNYIIIHSSSSCFTIGGIKHSPVAAYDLNFNMDWEKCFSDSSDSRFNYAILPQDNQILAVGHKRTGMIQPGEKPEDYLSKQKLTFLRYDTLGNLKWQKSINEPLRIVDFENGNKDEFYVLLETDLYLNKRMNYSFTIEDEEFNTNKKDNYFLVKYK